MEALLGMPLGTSPRSGRRVEPPENPSTFLRRTKVGSGGSRSGVISFTWQGLGLITGFFSLLATTCMSLSGKPIMRPRKSVVKLSREAALDTKGRIHKIMEIKANALMNTPTYGLHIAEEARNMGIDPADLKIERMLCAGEPMPTATRKRLEELYHCHVFDHIGGTEPCAWAGMCGAKDGMHVIEPFFLVEILDRETLQREVDEGEMGVAVVTPLGRRSISL